MRSKMESLLNPLTTLEKKTNKLPTTEEPWGTYNEIDELVSRMLLGTG